MAINFSNGKTVYGIEYSFDRSDMAGRCAVVVDSVGTPDRDANDTITGTFKRSDHSSSR